MRPQIFSVHSWLKFGGPFPAWRPAPRVITAPEMSVPPASVELVARRETVRAGAGSAFAPRRPERTETGATTAAATTAANRVGIPASAERTIQLDASQQAVVELPDGASAAVLGAPGTGKTTTIVEIVADRVLTRGWSADEIIVLTTARGSATRLRDAIALRLAVPTNGPVARTVNSLAFDVVGHAARIAGSVPPKLVTGGEQDSDIAQLLEGQLDGDSVHDHAGGPNWPDFLGPEVRRLRGFRSELRELMARATEYGVDSPRLRALAQRFDRPEWAASADFIDEYLSVIASLRPHQLDSAELAQFAAAAIASDDPGARVARLRLVIIDDLQEATESTLAILRALAGRGIAIIACGDPDVATNAFRGGEPDALGRLGSLLGVPETTTVVLGTAHRQNATLRAFTSTITARIGTALAGAQRAAVANTTPASAEQTTTEQTTTGQTSTAQGDNSVLTVQASTSARMWSAVARALREHHVLQGVPFSEMAVIVRSGDQVASLRRVLSLAEVPARTATGTMALRDDRAARALLTLVDVGVGRSPLTPPLAVELLTGVFGGLDRLALRRLRLALRAEELAGGGNRSSDELLVEALSAPGRFATIDNRVARRAESLTRILAGLRTDAATGATIEELFWFAWESSGLAPLWQEQAMGTGIAATEANSSLDGILALFTAARRFVERQPATPAAVFLAAVLDAEVPEDSLSPQQVEGAVLITTASGAVGLEFEIVVVAGLQEGGWPNLRLRGSLLGPAELVRAVTGVDSANLDERKLVLSDELRMFALAVSRARRQVILAAVANEDEAASVFFSLVPVGTAELATSGLPPLSLRGLTGRLRRELLQPRNSLSERRAAASALARLATEKVPGADPADWHGLAEPSTTEPLYGPDERVPVSPSRLEAFEKSAPDWFIDSIAGSESSNAMAVGTIVHWAMEHASEATVDAVWAGIESRWSELLFESPWLAEAQRKAARVLAGGIAEYLVDFERDGKSLVSAEGRFTLEVGIADVRGSIDRLERSTDGTVMIVDLKTGKPITNAADIAAHPQLGVYQLAYAQGVLGGFLDELGEHHAGGAKLLFVKQGLKSKLYREGVQPALTEAELEGFRQRIREAARRMAAAEFVGVLELPGFGGSPGLALHRVKAVSSD
jgi:superfamily I DNA/RNA helicase/RecB family exonuclease